MMMGWIAVVEAGRCQRSRRRPSSSCAISARRWARRCLPSSPSMMSTLASSACASAGAAAGV
jgi:hypothetical protein